jgi:hypothetical protein
MPQSISDNKPSYRSRRRNQRGLAWGMGSVRQRGEWWEARWCEGGARPSRVFATEEEAEDFLRVIFRAKGRMTREELSQAYDNNFVYFIRGERGGPIKIGHAANPSERLKAMQTGSPVKLRIIGIVPGGIRKEAELHKQFGYLHAHNEWFRSSKELLKWIRENAVRTDMEDAA